MKLRNKWKCRNQEFLLHLENLYKNKNIYINKLFILSNFDTYFINPSRRLASFEEVKNNWDYYKTQLPSGYNLNYRYEDVRYSNWTKVPILLPSIKKILDLSLGKKEADTISLRIYFLRKYNLCFNVFAIFFIIVFSFTVRKLIKAKVFPKQNIPVTFSNVYKYLRLRLFEKKFTEQGRA